MTSIDRRRFLAALGGATAGLALGGAAGAMQACAPAPGRRGAIDPLGLQLYTVRSLMARDVAGTLEQVAGIGYREVEFAGYFDHEPDRLRELLDRLDLAAPSAHVMFEALEGEQWPRTREAAEVLGHRYLVIPWIPPDARRSLDDYRRVADRLERAGARVAEAGHKLAYHNHEFEFEPLDGTVPFDILAGTDPDLVAFQLDLFWVRHAGQDPIEYFRRHPGRFPSVHVKDMAADGSMVDVGAGEMDWAGIFAHADTAGIRHYFVEHDEPADPLSSVRNSYQHLSRLEV
jgi:sugar phosphate isomerase/epimerase